MLDKKYYITTAIDYVNAKPHIGHAFEKVLADSIARWKKLLGREVWFLTGTDENAQKNVQAAKAANVPTKEFVTNNSRLFAQLCDKLNVGYDDFIRTTEDRHIKTAQLIFREIAQKGDIYKGKYDGCYCVGCEAFITDKDLVDGRCPEHNAEPEWLSEEVYLFKLSKYRERLIEFVPKYVIPELRAREILSRLKNEDLRDICVTRAKTDWGIDFPIDERFKIYVWIEALINYISGAHGNWPADLHVIGKGINWFHSVIWPAMLMSAGYELPKNLLVHGYLNLKGLKISKSLGNIIDPLELLEKYPADSLRYSLLRNSVFEDSNISEEIFISRHNNELADKLGNLVSRVSTLAEKYGVEKCENSLLGGINLEEIEKHFEGYEIDKALRLIFNFIDSCNEYIQRKKVWETKDKKVLYELIDSIKTAAILLWPIIPETSERIAMILKFKIKSIKQIEEPLENIDIRKSEILFKKIKD